jgi:transcriptional regulator GlxA family with amidase domain
LLRHTRQERSVAEVAIHYGFTHLGRFSMQYRRHFGESPLASLQRPVTKAH